MSRLRLVFLGSADFSIPTLSALLAAGHDVIAVYSQPPRPAGRGQKLRRSPVHELADQQGIGVRTPITLRSTEEQARFCDLGVDAAVVAAYGLILPAAILQAPRYGCLNVHGSLLPRWRGAAPIQRAILAGDAQTGVTIMQMDEGLDTGDMLMVETVTISSTDTASDLHDRLASLGADMMGRTLERLVSGGLKSVHQPVEGVTYARKIDRHEGRLVWSERATTLERMVRALNPAPGVWFTHDDNRLKVLKADIIDAQGIPGRVLDDQLTVACGDQALRPTLIQRAGRTAVSSAEFLRGYPIATGTQLS